MRFPNQIVSIAMVLSFLVPNIVQASRCTSIVNRINKDLAFSESIGEKKPFPWMSLAWLEQQLGAVTPKKNDDNQNEYTWKCKDNDQAWLTATANGEQLVHISGQYSNNQGSGIFSTEVNIIVPPPPISPTLTSPPAPVGESAFEAKPSVPAVATNPIFKPEDLQKYNSKFQTNFTTQEQLIADDLQRAQKYIENLRNCLPGTYEFAMPIPTVGLQIVKAVIYGKVSTACKVETSTYIASMGNLSSTCEYQPEDLLFFDDKFTQDLIQGNVPSDPSHPTEYEKMMQKRCKEFINGVPS